MLSKDSKSIPALVGDVVEQLSHLIVTEARLTQAELSEKIDGAKRGLAYLVAAGVLMIPAVVMLLIALALWLAQLGMAAPLAYLISAGIGAALSSVLLVSGVNRLDPKRLRLERTTRQVHQDLAAARNLAR
jgi:hypothetical protein